MLCDNCGENEATVKVTQITNGKKIELMLCEECSEKIGITDINFEIPINISNFLGDFISEYDEESFSPITSINKQIKCNNCNMTYEEFLRIGKFGCSECYKAFSNKVDIMLKKIQGTEKYLGRKAINTTNNNIVEDNKTDNDIEKLKQDLKLAIKEERYEDAAKIRDEINKKNK